MEPIGKRPRIAEDVAEAIRRYIVDERLAPGDMLPSERQIQQQMQVSRATVREALRLLQMMGLVEARHGKGLFVIESNLQPMVDAYVNTLSLVGEGAFEHLLAVREALELGATDLAAKLRTDDDLAKMESVLAEAAERVERGDDGLTEDLGFHDLLIEATHNPLLVRLYTCIAPFLVEVRSRSLSRFTEEDRLRGLKSKWEEAIAQHTEIFHAIRDQDEARAVRLMHEHLRYVRLDLQAGLAEMAAAAGATN